MNSQSKQILILSQKKKKKDFLGCIQMSLYSSPNKAPQLRHSSSENSIWCLVYYDASPLQLCTQNIPSPRWMWELFGLLLSNRPSPASDSVLICIHKLMLIKRTQGEHSADHQSSFFVQFPPLWHSAWLIIAAFTSKNSSIYLLNSARPPDSEIPFPPLQCRNFLQGISWGNQGVCFINFPFLRVHSLARPVAQCLKHCFTYFVWFSS